MYGCFIWRTGDRKKTNRTTPSTLQGRMQARPSGTWHKLRLLGSYCHRDAWRHTVKVGLSQYEETQQLKVEEKRLHKRLHVQPIDQLQPSHVPNMIGTATPELVFTVTTDAAKWVQIYGLLRPTDANDDNRSNCVLITVGLIAC